MWPFNRRDPVCRSFEVRLADYLDSLDSAPGGRPDPVLASHLAVCVACREALDLACQAGPLVREGAARVPGSLASDPYFAVRVSARIREHAGRSSEFLPQLQSASLRLMAGGLSVALLLGALSAAGVTRSSRPRAAGLQPAGLRTVSPEMNPAPANPDDVVIALLTSERGRQPR